MLEIVLMSNIGQQILALDARYNVYRTPNNPHFRTLYIRRRSQLLREKTKTAKDPSVRKDYLRLRSQLLSDRYGVVQSEGSIRSRMSSSRCASQLTLQEEVSTADKDAIVPTVAADASRALVGDTSISENYSFAGVHHVFEQHSSTVTRVRFAHDERHRLAIASSDGTLSICSVNSESNASNVLLMLKGHTQAVSDFCWSITNDILVSCSLDGGIRVWDPNSGECIRAVEDACALLCCAFQPLNNNLVVTGNQKGLVQVVNISTGKYIKTGTCRTTGAATAMCCDNTGRLLWIGDDKGYVFSFQMDLTSGKLVKGRKHLICQGRPISSLTSRAWISREARDPCLLISVAANMLCLYRVTGSDGALQFRRKFPIKHLSYGVRSNFCPLMSFRQGACVLSGSEDSCVYLFDVEREGRPCLNKLQGHAAAVMDVCFNHDESFLASGDAKGTVIIWKRQKRQRTPPE